MQLNHPSFLHPRAPVCARGSTQLHSFIHSFAVSIRHVGRQAPDAVVVAQRARNRGGREETDLYTPLPPEHVAKRLAAHNTARTGPRSMPAYSADCATEPASTLSARASEYKTRVPGSPL